MMLFFVYFSFSQTEEYSIDLMLQNLNEETISFNIESIDKKSCRLLNISKEICLIEVKKYSDAIVYYPIYKQDINEIGIGEGVASGGCLIVYLKNVKKYFVINYFSGFYLARENESLFELDFHLSQQHLYSGFVFFDRTFSLEFIISIKSSYHMKMIDEEFEENKSYFSIINCKSPDDEISFHKNYLYQSEKFEDIVKMIYQKTDSLSIEICKNKDIISERTILPKWVTENRQ